jgi:hypothetical protein
MAQTRGVDSSGEGDALLLASAQVDTLLANLRQVARWKVRVILSLRERRARGS